MLVNKFDINKNYIGSIEIDDLVKETKRDKTKLIRSVLNSCFIKGEYFVSFNKTISPNKKIGRYKNSTFNIFNFDKQLVFTGTGKQIKEKYSIDPSNLYMYVKEKKANYKKQIFITNSNVTSLNDDYSLLTKPVRKTIKKNNTRIYVYDENGKFLFSKLYSDLIVFFSAISNSNSESNLTTCIRTGIMYKGYYLSKRDRSKKEKIHTKRKLVYLFDLKGELIDSGSANYIVNKYNIPLNTIKGAVLNNRRVHKKYWLSRDKNFSITDTQIKHKSKKINTKKRTIDHTRLVYSYNYDGVMLYSGTMSEVSDKYDISISYLNNLTKQGRNYKKQYFFSSDKDFVPNDKSKKLIYVFDANKKFLRQLTYTGFNNWFNVPVKHIKTIIENKEIFKGKFFLSFTKNGV